MDYAVLFVSLSAPSGRTHHLKATCFEEIHCEFKNFSIFEVCRSKLFGNIFNVPKGKYYHIAEMLVSGVHP